MKQYRWLVLAILVLGRGSAWAFNPDAGAVAVIVADILVTGKTALGPPPATPPPSMVAVSAGAFDVSEQTNLTSVYGAEYRFGGQHFWNSQPVVGFAITANRSIYGYGGLRFNLPLPCQFVVASTFALAGYDQGNGKYLGSPVEAYFELSIGRRFSNNMVVEIAARHLSHDDVFGTYDPGVDIVALSLAIPIK
ncbi:MAG TPA: hypothetical protein VK440_04315 [Burkholderiales bacterium]|nr:hypothetical protein [Burkholderiales bacterium]